MIIPPVYPISIHSHLSDITFRQERVMANTVSDLERQMDAFQSEFRRVNQEISKVIVGYSDVIDDILIAIIVKGLVYLKGVSIMGKSNMVQTSNDMLHQPT